MSDLDKLKDLLFGAEKQVLDSISERVESRELRSADVADVLPEAIHASHAQGGELRESLREPVGQCLQREFRDDPQTYSDVLYPVMGPAIRKSIMHALRSITQQINEAVEHSLTPKGLSWRLQAWRAGVPFGQFIVQKTLLYRVEQAYLISRDNGLLVGHAQHEAATIKDSDAVSAMFTAIQDFVKESFSPDRTGRLESADMGEFTLWAVHGPHALLVCVIRGVPPRSLRGELSAILERIHFRYGDAIRAYAGDTSSVPEVDNELAACLQLEARQETEKSGKRISWPLLIILLLIAGAVGYVAVKGWLQAREVERLRAALDDTPGLYVANLQRDGDTVVVRGMRDPLAPTVSAVAAQNGIVDANIVTDMQAYQSLDPVLIARRAAARFGTPEGVGLTVEGSKLIVDGPAPADWQAEVTAQHSNLAGIDEVEFLVPAAPQTVPGPDEDLLRLDAEIEVLTGRSFYFAVNATPTAESKAELPAYLDRLMALAEDAARLEQQLTLTVTGFADPIGSIEINSLVAERRAEFLATALRDRGWSGNVVTRSNPQFAANDLPIDLEQRRATIELQRAASPTSQ